LGSALVNRAAGECRTSSGLMMNRALRARG
jgi:hypothetical protein